MNQQLNWPDAFVLIACILAVVYIATQVIKKL